MYFIVLHQSHLLLSIIPITFQFFVSSSKVSPEPVSLTCFCSEEKSFKIFFIKFSSLQFMLNFGQQEIGPHIILGFNLLKVASP